MPSVKIILPLSVFISRNFLKRLNKVFQFTEKFIRFIGDKGTILWSADPNRISIGTGMEQVWEQEKYTCDRNDMFLEVAREFVSVLDGQAVKTCGLPDGVLVMELVEAIRESQKKQRTIGLD